MSATWPYTAITEPNFSTGAGLADIPAASTSLTALATRLSGAWIENTLATPEWVTITDGSDVPIVQQFPLPPNMPATYLEFLFNLKITGVKWLASQAAGIKGKIEGWQ